MAHAMNKKNKGKDSPHPHDKGKFRYGDVLRRSATAMCGVKRESVGNAEKKMVYNKNILPHGCFWFVGTPPPAPPLQCVKYVWLFPEEMEVHKLCAAIRQPHCQRRAMVGIRGPSHLPQDVGKKKKLRRVRHPEFQHCN
ncbi:uncharacterized protein TM35_000041110 [Trypanosoma theileri]|uniref:Uncharacterized protein n=1 Tax=Trypanosoma theileri TaxID=67003 RepID=A0A1X0P4N2_9TRYP|nr:uncharacterized protein TM35_000041110 [Trypanosoma theileri]ORC91897.1 hypothetical protein TM35_000041110 [Trypanosoma theileri]